MSFMDHAAGQQCLLHLANILDSLQIPFFLIQGTALGAYRDHGFTPTERDIDLGILQEQLTGKAQELLLRLIKEGFDTETFATPFTSIRTLVAFKYGVKADLVGLGKWQEQRFTASPVRPWVHPPYAIVHEAAMLEQYEPVALFGRTFNVPSPIETYLALEYDDWRTPRDDHVSRTRIYNYLEATQVPHDLFEKTQC